MSGASEWISQWPCAYVWIHGCSEPLWVVASKVMDFRPSTVPISLIIVKKCRAISFFSCLSSEEKLNRDECERMKLQTGGE